MIISNKLILCIVHHLNVRNIHFQKVAEAYSQKTCVETESKQLTASVRRNTEAAND